MAIAPEEEEVDKEKNILFKKLSQGNKSKTLQPFSYHKYDFSTLNIESQPSRSFMVKYQNVEVQPHHHGFLVAEGS